MFTAVVSILLGRRIFHRPYSRRYMYAEQKRKCPFLYKYNANITLFLCMQISTAFRFDCCSFLWVRISEAKLRYSLLQRKREKISRLLLTSQRTAAGAGTSLKFQIAMTDQSSVRGSRSTSRYGLCEEQQPNAHQNKGRAHHHSYLSSIKIINCHQVLQAIQRVICLRNFNYYYISIENSHEY